MPREDQPGVVVIGVGNPYRNDDSAGLVAARRLRELALPAVQVFEHESEGVALIELLAGAAAAILIDAASSGGTAGTIQRIDARTGPVPAQMFRHSTHAFDIAGAIELARALNQLPLRVVVFGIEGANFEAGTELSGEVEAALPVLVARVIQQIQDFRL
jgi:hydrogenase maturation protease